MPKPRPLYVFQIALLLGIICWSSNSVLAHSWLDCSNMVGSTCKGFPLGYPSRSNPDINTLYTYLIENRRPTAPVCQPGRQTAFIKPSTNTQFPPARVMPGESLHLTWQANGHLNENRPTVVEIHWAGGKPGRLLHTRSELGPKTLLTTMGFASAKNCDNPANPNTWCHGQFKIPAGTKAGTYQVVWWWKFDQNPVGEEYSTCFEVVVQTQRNGYMLYQG
ncbi:hypothetical protein CPB97_001072 [Podila verticillata]|nr:hypothetical protein CPB97_001072 [Podila verticillata]